jgi:hypothetical protein
MSATPIDRRPQHEGGVPRDGDIVVTPDVRRARYLVRQLPGDVQFSSTRRAEAVRLATGFGREHAVDVWYCEAGAYRLLEHGRPGGVAATPAGTRGRSLRRDH